MITAPQGVTTEPSPNPLPAWVGGVHWVEERQDNGNIEATAYCSDPNGPDKPMALSAVLYTVHTHQWHPCPGGNPIFDLAFETKEDAVAWQVDHLQRDIAEMIVQATRHQAQVADALLRLEMDVFRCGGPCLS